MRARVLVLLFVLLTGLSSAEVVDFGVKPENPVKGDVVTIYGTAGPNEEVRIDISYERDVPVQNGEYIFSVDGIEIPDGKNKFTVTAYGCADLDVSARRRIIGGLYTPWVTLSEEATGGIASISQSAPPGTYDVLIHGRSNRSSVRLKITATGYVKADESGRFSYSYETSSVPLGEFVVSAGGLTKIITLAEPSGGLSEGGPPAPAPASAPVSTPTPTPTPAPTPAQTSTPAGTPAATSTRMQGFESIIAIVSLILAVLARGVCVNEGRRSRGIRRHSILKRGENDQHMYREGEESS